MNAHDLYNGSEKINKKNLSLWRKKIKNQKLLKEAFDDGFPPINFYGRVTCIHCGDQYRQSDMKYEKRFNKGINLWWCKNKNCDGGGLFFDIMPGHFKV